MLHNFIFGEFSEQRKKSVTVVIHCIPINIHRNEWNSFLFTLSVRWYLFTHQSSGFDDVIQISESKMKIHIGYEMDNATTIEEDDTQTSLGAVDFCEQESVKIATVTLQWQVRVFKCNCDSLPLIIKPNMKILHHFIQHNRCE